MVQQLLLLLQFGDVLIGEAPEWHTEQVIKAFVVLLVLILVSLVTQGLNFLLLWLGGDYLGHVVCAPESMLDEQCDHILLLHVAYVEGVVELSLQEGDLVLHHIQLVLYLADQVLLPHVVVLHT